MILSVAAATPAAAHKATMFASPQGKAISGEAYFRDGAPVRGARVAIFDATGTKLGETQTDAAGKFSFEPRRRCDHRFVVDGGDGHAAQYTVRAEELPADLPDGGGTLPVTSPTRKRGIGNDLPSLARRASDAHETGPIRLPDAASADPPGERISEPSGSHQDLRGELEAIQAQIVQLRRDLTAREDRARWSDVLGGVGYILGLMGLAFYFLGVRRKTMKDGS